jgi:peptidoglycan/LPS O-acetylase OafA/YrhL
MATKSPPVHGAELSLAEDPNTARAGRLPSSGAAGAPIVLAPLGARLAGVDGLRAIAEGCILIYHCWIYSSPTGEPLGLGAFGRFLLPHLPVGVSLFFALSGFLLYRSLAIAILRRKPLPSISRYLRNRALRIFPAYWTILAVTGLILPAVMVRNSTTLELGRLSGQFDDLLKNMFLMQNYFRDSWDTGIGPVWSLAIELHFYLALPLLGLLAVRMGGRFLGSRGRALVALFPAIAIGIVGVIGSLAEAWTADWSNDYWHSTLVRGILYHADLFAFGIGLAVLWAATTLGLIRLPRWWRPAATLGLVFSALLAVGLTDRGILDRYQGAFQYEALLSLSCVLLIALVVLPNKERASQPVLVRILEWRPIAAIGLVSYSLFLWHEPVIRFLQQREMTLGGTQGFAVNLVFAALVSGLLAALTYRFVEAPFMRRKSSSA